jgi:hypothetical protein
LPEEYQKILYEFLKRENFKVFVEKMAKAIKRYSFYLRKTVLDQKYKNFIGGYNFIKQGIYNFKRSI